MARRQATHSNDELETALASPEVEDESKASSFGDGKITVKGRCTLPAATLHDASGKPEKLVIGHWRGGFHWSGTRLQEQRVTLQEFDELKADPNLALVYDEDEENLARVHAAHNGPSLELELQAAKLEAEAAELRAKAARAQLEETERRNVQLSAQHRQTVSDLETKLRSGR
jgi:hypothetical protein